MKKLIALLTAAVATLTSAWAATPVAVWEGDFPANGTANQNFTLTYNTGNTLETDAETGKNYIQIGNTSGVGVTFIRSSTLGATTVLVKYSDYTPSAATTIATFKVGNSNNRAGIAHKADGTLQGLHSGGNFNDGSNTFPAVTEGVKTIAYRYSNNGIACFDGSTELYRNGGYKWQNDFSGNGAVNGFTLGGATGATLDSHGAASGMKIHSVAVFNAELSGTDIAAYKWPSDVITYTCTVDGETVSWDAELPAELDENEKIVFTGSGTVALPKGHAGATITVGSGVTLVVSESGLTQTKLTNEGTVHFVGGTLEAPIEMTLDGAHQSGFGVVTIAADSVLKTTASNQNKKYLVTGAADGSSTLILASTRDWGMQTDSRIRNCTAIIKNNFWFENAANLDKTVDVIVEGGTLHISCADAVIGALSGSGNLFGPTRLTLNLDRCDGNYTGTIKNASGNADSAVSVLTVNGAEHSQTFTGSITSLVANTTVTTSAQISEDHLSTTISGFEVQETDNQDGTFTYTPVKCATVAHIGETTYATIEEAIAAANESETPVTITLDVGITAETIELGANVTLDCSESIYTGAVTGSGTIKFVGFGSVPAAVKTSLQNEAWTGTLSVSPATSGQLGSGDNTVGAAPTYKTLLNDFGNEGSKIEFDNFVAETNINFFGLTADEDSVIKPEVVITGTFSIRNGYSHRSDTAGYHTTFRKISGDGLIDCPREDRFSPLYYILDASDFTGSLNTTSSKFVFGPCEETDTVEKIPSPSTYSGFIWVKEGTTINVAEGKTFSATTMIVDGTLNTHTALETTPTTYLEGMKIVAPEAVEGVYTYAPTAITYVTLTIETVDNCAITVKNGETVVETGAAFDVDDATELTVTRTPAEGYHLADGCLAEETISMTENKTVSAEVEEDATDLPGEELIDDEEKEEYKTWADANGVTAETTTDHDVLAIAFHLGATISEGVTIEAAAQAKVKDLLKDIDLAALAGEGGEEAALTTLNTALAEKGLVASLEPVELEGASESTKLYKLVIELAPKN